VSPINCQLGNLINKMRHRCTSSRPYVSIFFDWNTKSNC